MNRDLIDLIKEVIDRDDRIVSLFVDTDGDISINITPFTATEICMCEGVE